MKNIALVPLAALSILIVSLLQEWLRLRLDARLGWDPRSGIDFDLLMVIGLPFQLTF